MVWACCKNGWYITRTVKKLQKSKLLEGRKKEYIDCGVDGWHWIRPEEYGWKDRRYKSITTISTAAIAAAATTTTTTTTTTTNNNNDNNMKVKT
jgi:hypothetical protein